jgi:transcriptional regulator with XRE-family HTH domain
MTIGEIIRKKRIASGMTQKQLAEKVGLTNASVSNIEKGLTCNIQSLVSICDALDLNLTIEEKGNQTIDHLDYDIGLCVGKLEELKNLIQSMHLNKKKFK